MENIDNLREMSFQYFSGKLEIAREKELFTALKNNTALQEQFRQWEKDWLDSVPCDTFTQREWERLNKSMNAESQKISLWNSNWSKVAAAILLVLISSFFAGWFVSDMQTKENFYTSYAPLGEKSQVELPDGTKVWLNAGSSLTYSSLYGKRNRNVFLRGEGYFEVTTNEELEFVVGTAANYQVIVKGTKFNMSAYDEDSYISTSLLEGIVEINYKEQKLLLKPGQMAKLKRESNKITCIDINLSQSKAWLEDRIEFDKITLSELLPKLARIYNADIQILLKDTAITNRTIRISLRNRETLNEVFTALKQILPIKTVQEDSCFLIKER